MPTHNQITSAGKFFLLLAIFFAVLLFLSAAVPENFFEKITAKTSNAVYGAIGTSGTIKQQDSETFIEIKDGPKIFFSALCTGVLETILLVAAIAATFEISKKKRLLGIAVGIVSVFTFNILRIAITTLAILYAGIETAEFAHNILFRVFLFIAIAGLYAGWYKWATQNN